MLLTLPREATQVKVIYVMYYLCFIHYRKSQLISCKKNYICDLTKQNFVFHATKLKQVKIDFIAKSEVISLKLD